MAEVVSENNESEQPTVIEILTLQTVIDSTVIAINQKQVVAARTRGNDTTCLYLSLDNRAWSLSTLIAVDVKIDTWLKTKPELLNSLFM